MQPDSAVNSLLSAMSNTYFFSDRVFTQLGLRAMQSYDPINLPIFHGHGRDLRLLC